MYYTIIANSGWQGDMWRVVETIENKQEANEKARNLQRHDPRYINYQIGVKAHRKNLWDLVNLDNATATFSDGTKALVDL